MSSPTPVLGASVEESTPLRNASPDEIRATFALQQANRWTVASRTARERIESLKRLRSVLLETRTELFDALWADLHKPATESELTELQPVLSEIGHTIKHLRKWMRPRKVRSTMTMFGTHGEIRSEPKGVVLVIAPWNFPFQLLVDPIVAAVAAGNVVCAKPSEKTPSVSRYISRLIARVFPPEEVAVFEGDAEVAKSLLALPFDHIFFTGSTMLGRIIMEAAAKHLSSVTLELGGKSPAIVDASADVEAAADRIVWGRFVNAGQTCVAPDYVLVHESIKARFLEKARDAIGRAYGASDADRKRSGDYCRIVDGAAFDRLSGLLDDAIERGALLAAGGQRDAAERYIAPTILTDIPSDAEILKDEIFGPILLVIGVRSIDEAIAAVRSRPKPLALYVFSKDSRATERVLAQTTAGGTAVNNVVIHFVHPNLPFGGVGESGLGNYHGEAGFRTFSHERSILRQGLPALFGSFYPPYTPRVAKFVGAVTRWLSS